jgi:hydroxymethylbilane synthase
MAFKSLERIEAGASSFDGDRRTVGLERMKIRCGTRGSLLALAQTDQITSSLIDLHPSLEIEKVIIQTSGDRFGHATDEATPPEPAPQAPNVKAMFVKELDEALLAGSIDFAVHSCKDIPANLPDGLEIAAFPEREDPRDAYIGGDKAPDWEMVPADAVIGTSSLRRQIQLRLARPGISFVPMRGNVDKRLKRLAEGTVSAIVLAEAGLKRLGYGKIEHQILPTDVIVPAPGQGALALEARSDRRDILDLLIPLEHPKTRIEVECERLFLKAMNAGCSTPLGAFAHAEMPVEKNTMATVKFSAFWSDNEGKTPIRRSGACANSPERIAAFVQDIADQIRNATNGDGR